MNAVVQQDSFLENLLRLRGNSQERLAQAIRLALIVFVIAALGLVAANLIVGTRIRYYLVESSNMAMEARDVDRGILEMRRNEKDFFDRKDQEELDKHAKNYEATMAALNRLRSNPRASADDLKLFDTIGKNTEAYNTLFLKAAESQKTLGYNENTGQQGDLRDKVHAVEAIALKTGSVDLEAAMLMLRRHEKDFILRGRDEYVTKHNEAMEKFYRVLDGSRLDSATSSQVRDLITAYAASFAKYVTATRDLEKSLDAARNQAHTAQSPLPEFAAQASERRDAELGRSLLILGLTALALLLVFLGLGLLLRRSRVNAETTFAERLSAQQKAEAENEQLNNSVISILQAVNQLSQKDLTAKAPVTQDIIGTVSDSINLLTDETSKVLHGVTNIAGQVQHVSNKVKTQADQVSKTAEEERQNVNHMVESLFDATQTMNQVAALAEQSNHSAEQATQVTDNALETVNGTVKGMESIRETIAETEERIKRLGERSQEITGIVNLINTISERTHVLALNASMQAAVAGEAGRGFAVVAEEVQRLAESSRNATQQIGTLVNNIQIETNETISTVNRTIGQVVQGSEQAQKAGEQMRRTQEITSQLVGQVRKIAAASEQQKAMSATLLEAVQRIGKSTENTAEQIQAQNKETETLLQASRQLVESVNVFKLPQAA